MSDIFISYAREDRTEAGLLADLLIKRGWTVWWDQSIPAGKAFDEIIENELDSAKCVIVLWSKTSVYSGWVKAEAAEGARRGILIPILLENVRVPLEFRRLQTITVSNWQDDVLDAELAGVFSAVDTVLDSARTSETVRDSQLQAFEDQELSEGLISRSKEWRAEVISKSGTERTIGVHLPNGKHVVEVKYYRITTDSDLVIKVNGNLATKSSGTFDRVREFSFLIHDGPQPYPTTITLYPTKVLSFTLGIDRVRLQVAGHTLYEESGE